jgi:uncharacterized protein (DUF1330 family)
MAALVLVDVEIHDFNLYESYKALTPATVAAFGGKFVSRGNPTQSLEGNWNPQRLVILEFPTKELALAWWHSPEYENARAIRNQAATTKLLVVETS